MTDLEGLIGVVASHGLGPMPASPVEVTADVVEELLMRAEADRLVGLLDQALSDGALRGDEPVTRRVGEAAVRTQMTSLVVERHHLVVHGLFAEAGIDHRFLKGPTIAHRFYAHPGLRQFRDVDVLIQGQNLDRAVAVLEAVGHTRLQPPLLPGFDRRYGKSVTLRSADGIEVDVHRTLASGPFGVRPPEVLWARPPSVIELGGSQLPALDSSATFVNVCVHAVTGARTVTSTLRDLVETAPSHDQIDGVRELAQDLGATACVPAACGMAVHALARVPASTATMAAWPITRRERSWLDLYVRRAGFRRMSLAAVTATPGLRAKGAHLAVLVRAQRARSAS